MKLHKITSYENAKGEQRIMLTAVEETPMLGGLATAKMFGKLYLPVGVKLEDVEVKFNVGDELPGVKFGEKYVDSETGETENFHRIIPE